VLFFTPDLFMLGYGQSGTNELVLLSKGNSVMFSRWTGEGTDVYLDGGPFIHFERSPDGSVTNLSMTISDNHGNMLFTLSDRHVKGQWDVKIDDVTGKVYVWKNGRWVQH
jgi:hypothetical protein